MLGLPIRPIAPFQCRPVALRPHRASVNPRFYRRDLGGAQTFSDRRHLFAIGRGNALIQAARGGIPCDNDRIPHGIDFRIQPQAAALFLRVVTSQAMCGENWSDVAVKRDLCGGKSGRNEAARREKREPRARNQQEQDELRSVGFHRVIREAAVQYDVR